MLHFIEILKKILSETIRIRNKNSFVKSSHTEINQGLDSNQ